MVNLPSVYTIAEYETYPDGRKILAHVCPARYKVIPLGYKIIPHFLPVRYETIPLNVGKKYPRV